MNPYPEYKETNLPWLPRIPKHWEVRKIKYILSERREVSNTGTEQLLCLSQYSGITPKNTLVGRFSESLIGYRIVKRNDIVMNIMLAWNGSTAMSAYEGVVSPAYAVFYSKGNANPRFLHYLFKIQQVMQYFKAHSSGVIESRLRLYPDEFAKLSAILPSPAEQAQIVRYLDAMTAKINRLIRAKKKAIALLQEQKQAIINQAVTKGLNPNAEMKDSGIDWIGMVPKHWEINRLGHFSSMQNGISASAEYFGEGYPFMNYGDVYNNFELPQKLSGLAKSTQEDQVRYSVQKGDIFFTRTSETIEEIAFSAVCTKTIPNATFSGFLIRVRPRANIIIPMFSKYYFRCLVLRNYFVKEMNLVTRASLSQQLLRNLPVLFPPIGEQEQIANYLEQKTQEYDKLIYSFEKEITLFQDYKSSLISSVVTGTIDIRSFKINDAISLEDTRETQEVDDLNENNVEEEDF